MKTATLHFDETMYRNLTERAAEKGISAVELIHEAMRCYLDKELPNGPSLADIRPVRLKPRYQALDISDVGMEILDDQP